MKTFAAGLLAFLSGLVIGCDRSQPAGAGAGGGPAAGPVVAQDGRPRLPRIGRLVSSPFLARCEAVPVRGGRIAQLVDEAMGADRGEVVWGHRSFGGGGGRGDQGRYETTAEYDGDFIFRRDGVERTVSATDADAILRGLKTSLERELKDSGVRTLDDKVRTDGTLVTGFTLAYEDTGMPAAGSIEAAIALPKRPGGSERLAGLRLVHRETCTSDRLAGDR